MANRIHYESGADFTGLNLSWVHIYGTRSDSYYGAPQVVGGGTLLAVGPLRLRLVVDRIWQ